MATSLNVNEFDSRSKELGIQDVIFQRIQECGGHYGCVNSSNGGEKYRNYVDNSESGIYCGSVCNVSEICCCGKKNNHFTTVDDKRCRCRRCQIEDDDDVDDDDDDNNFNEKLQEFVLYQPLQQYLDSDFNLGIPLASEEGKTIFVKAVTSPYMECYYKISPQIDNQTEYTCGSTSLVAALNSLGIDPAKATWYDEWRWHCLRSLSCCTPRLQNPSITMHQFSCLAVCNDSLAYPVTVKDEWSIDYFRSWVKFATSRIDVVMVVNYGRVVLCQNGSGHFLPLCGFSEACDMVLLVDIAKHKYPPCWVSLGHLLTAIKAPDNRHGGNRGFVLITRPDYNPGEKVFGPSLTLRLDDIPGRVDTKLVSFVDKWSRFLRTPVGMSSTRQEIIELIIHQFIRCIKFETSTPKFDLLDMSLIHFRCDHRKNPSIIARCRIPQCPSTCNNTKMYQQLQSLDIFSLVQICLASSTYTDRGTILDLVVGQLDNIDQAVSFAKSRCLGKGKLERLAKYLRDNQRKGHRNHKMSANMSSNQSKTQNEEKKEERCLGYIKFLPEHILTFLFLSWPFKERISSMQTHEDSISSFRKFIFQDTHFKSTGSDLHDKILTKAFEGLPSAIKDTNTKKVEHDLHSTLANYVEHDLRSTLANDVEHDLHSTLANDVEHDLHSTLANDVEHDLHSTLANDVEHDLHSTLANDVEHDLHSTLANDVEHDLHSTLANDVEHDLHSTLANDVEHDLHSTLANDVEHNLHSTLANDVEHNLHYTLTNGFEYNIIRSTNTNGQASQDPNIHAVREFVNSDADVFHPNEKHHLKVYHEKDNNDERCVEKNRKLVGDYMNDLVQEQFKNCDCSILKDHVRAMKRKILVILEYHQLLKNNDDE